MLDPGNNEAQLSEDPAIVGTQGEQGALQNLLADDDEEMEDGEILSPRRNNEAQLLGNPAMVEDRGDQGALQNPPADDNEKMEEVASPGPGASDKTRSLQGAVVVAVQGVDQD